MGTIMIREYKAMNMILYRMSEQYEDANITVIQSQIRKITTTSNNYVHYYTAMHAIRYDNDNNRGRSRRYVSAVKRVLLGVCKCAESITVGMML